MFKSKEKDEAQIKKIATQLTEGYTHHGYLIEFNEALSIGLKVSRPTEIIANEVTTLFELQNRFTELLEIDRKLKEHTIYIQKRRVY